ncbi:hypothetical protein GCM10020331_061800 [Ectobacillus funiculus]
MVRIWGKIVVHTPFVGGAYGGKAAVQLEVLAYLASKAVGGRPVKVWNDREEDMITSPSHIGLDATVKNWGRSQREKFKLWKSFICGTGVLIPIKLLM